MTRTKIDWTARATELSAAFAARAAAHDHDGTFVDENYDALRDAGLFAALVPDELGGGGATHAEICEALRILGRGCGSTALALSMHTHLVAAAVWRHRHGQPAEALLRRVAAERLVLISTGAGDWLTSNGEATRVDGGYRVRATKAFASGGPRGDLLVTSAPYRDPAQGWQVLHFAVPFAAPGVSVGSDWDTLGMRGTGSHTVRLDDVFVPDAAITLRRPREGWPPVLTVVATVALPIIVAPYVGVAEAASELACARARPDEPYVVVQVGELHNALAAAQLAYHALVDNCRNFDFAPELPYADRALTYKTLAAKAVRATTEKAMEVAGGAGFFRKLGLERLMRDAFAADYHPLPEKKQQVFSGRIALGMDPVAPAVTAAG